MSNQILLCTDLDRTLIPNGDALENVDARTRFKKLCSHPDIILTYVSGRDLIRVKEAIDTFDLPTPNFIVADVGSSIYHHSSSSDLTSPNEKPETKNDYEQNSEWLEKIADDWQGLSTNEIIKNIGIMPYATPQPDNQQGAFKISYSVTPSKHLNHETDYIHKILKNKDLKFNCISSIDETCDQGLIDILPASANKKLAVHFLATQLDIKKNYVFFSGDSGNDLDMLTSGYFATLVNNATTAVKQTATELANKNQTQNTLYIATGTPVKNFESNNGNYASGIIEGFLNFFPQYTAYVNLE